RRPKYHGRMSIVPASVHESVVFGAVGYRLFVVNPQSIGVGTNCDKGLIISMLRAGDDPSLALNDGRLNPRRLECIGQIRGRLVLLAARLGMGVQMPANRLQLVP